MDAARTSDTVRLVSSSRDGPSSPLMKRHADPDQTGQGSGRCRVARGGSVSLSAGPPQLTGGAARRALAVHQARRAAQWRLDLCAWTVMGGRAQPATSSSHQSRPHPLGICAKSRTTAQLRSQSSRSPAPAAGAAQYPLADRRGAAPRSHWAQVSSVRAADRGVPRDVLWVMSVEHHGLTVFFPRVRSSCPRPGLRCTAVARDEL